MEISGKSSCMVPDNSNVSVSIGEVPSASWQPLLELGELPLDILTRPGYTPMLLPNIALPAAEARLLLAERNSVSAIARRRVVALMEKMVGEGAPPGVNCMLDRPVLTPVAAAARFSAE